jgi:hypothetical protein
VDLTIAAQTVPVNKSTTYVLTYDARARDLRSLSNPQIEIFDAGVQTRLSVSTVTASQRRYGLGPSNRLEFTTSPQTEAITLRISSTTLQRSTVSSR